MSTEIVKAAGTQVSLRDRMDYARALAASGLLPDAYRGQPANVLLAIEYGQALRIPTMTAIQGIHIIKGKPTLSADLMAAKVRAAGHRLRVRVEDGPAAVAELTRSDDPEYTFVCRWDMDRARKAGLVSKENWSNFPAAMLKARAISEVIREGASEVLHGAIYTPEEMDPSIPVGADGNVIDGEVVESQTDGGAVAGDTPDDHAPPSDTPNPAQLRLLGTLMTRSGIKDKPDRLAYCDRVIGHPIESSKDLAPGEFQAVIEALQNDLANLTAADDGPPSFSADPPADAEPTA